MKYIWIKTIELFFIIENEIKINLNEFDLFLEENKNNFYIEFLYFKEVYVIKTKLR